MKETEFLDGVSGIDLDVVANFTAMDERLHAQQASSKSKRKWTFIAAAAASLVLIVGAVLMIPHLHGAGPEVTSDNPVPHYVPLVYNAAVSPEKLSGSGSVFVTGTSSAVGGAQADPAPPKFEFQAGGFIVKARVAENYPDVYIRLDGHPDYKPREYRLILMECLEVISGQGSPDYFFYLMPSYQYVDMSVYDSLLISMTQLGTEGYVLKNVGQSHMEAFDLPVFTDDQGHPELGNVIAFNRGRFDESLWQNESWIYGYQFARMDLDDPRHSDLVVRRGDSEKKVIANIEKQIAEWYGKDYPGPSVITLNFTEPEAKQAAAYVKPFENGVFIQQLSWNRDKIVFTRFINGCQTEEAVGIDLGTQEVTYSDVRYTADDLSRLEDLPAHVAKKAAEYAKQSPTPPHVDTEGKSLLSLQLYAWYVKADDRLYGVIRTSWRFREADVWYVQYYDDEYTLYDMAAGTAAVIPRDDLLTIVGSRNVYTGPYDVSIDMPMA